MKPPGKHSSADENASTLRPGAVAHLLRPEPDVSVSSEGSPLPDHEDATHQTVPLEPGSERGPDILLRIVRSNLAYRPAPDQDGITIGRQRGKPGLDTLGNDFVVRVEGDDYSSMRISRHHLRILRRDGCHFVEDQSTGGTLLNDHRLTRGVAVPLAIGDRLTLADVLFLDVILTSTAVAVVPAITTLHGGSIVFEACRGDLVSFP
jgi:hypothetical protein